jgi:ribosomal-protein-alanine N-acetyltransferase
MNAGQITEEGLAHAPAHSGRLALTSLRAEHTGALHPLIDDWEVVKMLAVVPWPVAYEDVASYVATKRGDASEEIAFCVVVGGQPIGVASVKRPGTSNPPRVMPRLGYWLGRPHWGQGHATEAVRLLAAEAFARYPDAGVIGAGVYTDNPASRRVLEKVGFARVGGYKMHCRSRDAEVQIDDMNLTWDAWATGGGR